VAEPACEWSQSHAHFGPGAREPANSELLMNRVGVVSELQRDLQNSGIAERNDRENAQVDAVMFDLWKRSYLDKSILSRALIILLSRMASIIFGVAKLPLTLARLVPEVVVAILLGVIVNEVTRSALGSHAALLSISFFILLMREQVITLVREFVFDLFDLLLFGALTRVFIALDFFDASRLRPMDKNDFRLFLYTSRISTGEYDLEMNAALEIAKQTSTDFPRLRVLINQYWEGGHQDKRFWRNALKSV